MNTIRLGVAVAVIGGHLYAVGGSDGSTPLATVERYEPFLLGIQTLIFIVSTVDSCNV